MSPVMKITMPKWNLCFCVIVLLIAIIWFIIYAVSYAWDHRIPPRMIYEADVLRYTNATSAWPRIPRVIHQIYRTHDVPSMWNATVQSVMEKNIGEFQYRRWSDAEMDAFVEEHEPEFHRKTYRTYPYNIQRADAFRYVLMFHMGGIYIDMDNGCNRPFRDLVVTLESLEPEATYLAALPSADGMEVESDFLISSANHPLYRQIISRLHLFNHYYFFHFWTVLWSTGPVYVSIQQRLFTSTKWAVVRLLARPVYRPMFIRKETASTWIGRDAYILLYIGGQLYAIFWYCKILIITIAVLTLIRWYKQRYKIIYDYICFYSAKILKIRNTI